MEEEGNVKFASNILKRDHRAQYTVTNVKKDCTKLIVWFLEGISQKTSFVILDVVNSKNKLI